jgi:hypothetical protein
VAVEKLFVEWLDISANFLRTPNYVGSTAALAAYLATLQTCSNAGIAIVTHGTPAFPAGASVDAQYPSVLDTAVLNFRSSAPATAILTIPAPVSALFLADNETVDSTDPLGIIAAAKTCLSDIFGNLVTTYVSGVRAQRRKDLV